MPSITADATVFTAVAARLVDTEYHGLATRCTEIANRGAGDQTAAYLTDTEEEVFNLVRRNIAASKDPVLNSVEGEFRVNDVSRGCAELVRRDSTTATVPPKHYR